MPGAVDGSGDAGPLPVFLFPGLTGRTAELSALRACAPDSITLVPVSYPGWDRFRTKGMGLQAFVRHCTEQIQRHSPSGPVCLIGYSFGGHVGLAVAAALAAAGRTDLQLGLLDTLAVPDLRAPPRTAQSVMRAVARRVRSNTVVFRAGLHTAKLLVRIDQAWLWRGAACIARAESRLWPARHLGEALQFNFNESILREIIAWMGCATARFGFPVTLFRCIEQQPEAAGDLGWGQFLEHLRIVPIPGGHSTWMHEPRPVILAFNGWFGTMTASMHASNGAAIGGRLACHPG